MNRNRKPPTGAVGIGITDEFDEGKGQEQRCKKVKGAVLIAGDEIVGAGLLPRQFKADFVIRSDFFNQFRLEHLQSTAQSADNTAAHRIRGPLVQAVRRFGGVGQRQNIEQAVQLALAALRDKVVHLTNVPLFWRVGKVNVQDQRFQQVHLAGIPETIALACAVGILNDDIYEKLRHQFLPLNFFQAVPRVGIFGADKVEHTHCVA